LLEIVFVLGILGAVGSLIVWLFIDIKRLDAAFASKLKQPRQAAQAQAEAEETPNVRRAIPERVRHEVWRRDQGHCVDCGSRNRLEFDHIIPVSRGGANSVRNIELRCETCNRQKGARV
jgi:hypothetical protein